MCTPSTTQTALWSLPGCVKSTMGSWPLRLSCIASFWSKSDSMSQSGSLNQPEEKLPSPYRSHDSSQSQRRLAGVHRGGGAEVWPAALRDIRVGAEHHRVPERTEAKRVALAKGRPGVSRVPGAEPKPARN